MIDVSRCTFEEKFRNELYKETVYYFIYTKDGMNEVDFYSEDDYGNVICTCIALTVADNGDCYVQMSPTIEEEDMLYDVDWRDLYVDFQYDCNTIMQLLNLANSN